jgi:sulfur-oxidizing protein SoxY
MGQPVSNTLTLGCKFGRQFGRRTLLAGGAGWLLLRSAQAAPAGYSLALQTAMRDFTAGAQARVGRVLLDISPLVENGNAVPVSVAVDSAMTAADQVLRVALFTTHNPQPDVAIFELGRLSGRAFVATRLRLATSQTVLAVAQLGDGSFWQHGVDVIVTLAACVEGG